MLQVEEDAGIPLAQLGIESKMSAQYHIDRTVFQTILGDRDIHAKAAELIAQITSLIQKTQRVHVTQLLNDAEVNGAKLHE